MSLSTSLKSHKTNFVINAPENWGNNSNKPNLSDFNQYKKERNSYYTKEKIKVGDEQAWVRDLEDHMIDTNKGYGGNITQYSRGVNKFVTVDYGKGGTAALGPLGKPQQLNINEHIVTLSNNIKGYSDSLSRQPVIMGDFSMDTNKNKNRLADRNQIMLSIDKEQTGVIVDERFKLKDETNNTASVKPSFVYNMYKDRKPDVDEKMYISNKDNITDIKSGKDTQKRFELNTNINVRRNINNRNTLDGGKSGSNTQYKYNGAVDLRPLEAKIKARDVSSNIMKNNLYKQNEPDRGVQLNNILNISTPDTINKPKPMQNLQPYTGYKTTRNKLNASNITPSIHINSNKQNDNRQYDRIKNKLNMGEYDYNSHANDPGKIWAV